MFFPIYYILLLTGRIDTDHLFKHVIFKNKFYVKEHWKSLSEEERRILGLG